MAVIDGDAAANFLIGTLGADTIRGFAAGVPGYQDFTFIGFQPFTAEGQLRVSFVLVSGAAVTIVQANTAGTSGADRELQLTGWLNLMAGDFL